MYKKCYMYLVSTASDRKFTLFELKLNHYFLVEQKSTAFAVRPGKSSSDLLQPKVLINRSRSE